jgi:DNA-binding FadR family transcriptional regulator
MRAADQEGFPEADLAFHAKITAMAGNVVLKTCWPASMP